ncbi:ankyrin-1-like isoform X2 [Photinus pyralis]|uniref:ankyrin-1-like isoform X2 n=1 Tax=Photinus pyralis TaxID=7054 RepID=UPI001267518E|nr:ankyrin-1-like isoform X2 [Photinus pyralis]
MGNIHSQSLIPFPYTQSQEYLSMEQEAEIRASITGLHVAASVGDLSLARSSLAEGLSVNCEIKYYRYTPLYFAIKNNRLEMVNFLIARGADLKHKVQKGFMPLSYACQEGHLDIVNTLIAHGADLNTKSDDLYTPLHLAAGGGHLDTINVLVKNGSDVNAASRARTRPLHHAVQSGNLEVIKTLISHGSDINAGCTILSLIITRYSDHTVDFNVTALHLGAKLGRSDIVKVLLKAGANCDAITQHKITSLHFACRGGFVEVVKALLEAKCNVNAKDFENVTPLHMATERNYLEVTKCLLLANGIDVNPKDHNNVAPLHTVCLVGHLQVVELLVKNNADIHVRITEGGTPLHIAVAEGHLGIVSCLLESGANANTLDEENWTPLHLAAETGNDSVVTMLLKYGANPSLVENIRKYTPLHLAAIYNHPQVVKTLIRNGAVVNATMRGNYTPLHLGAQHGNLEMVKFLLMSGAYFDAEAQTAPHVLPSQLAKKSRNSRLIKLFRLTEKLFTATMENNHLEVENSLKQGALVNIRSVHFQTPLIYASWKGYTTIVNLLLTNGANVNFSNKDKVCPLHFAAKFNNLEIVFSLLKHGAMFDAVSGEDGSTPQDCAQTANNIEIVNLLQLRNH